MTGILFIDMFESDTDAEKKGRWLPYGKCSFLVARAGGTNDAVSKAMTKAMRPHARRFKLGTIDAKEANALALGPFVETVLLGWKMSSDEAIPATATTPAVPAVLMSYSKENALKLLTDIPDLYAQLMEDAQNIATFAPEDIEDITKKLVTVLLYASWSKDRRRASS